MFFKILFSKIYFIFMRDGPLLQWTLLFRRVDSHKNKNIVLCLFFLEYTELKLRSFTFLLQKFS